MRKFFLLLALFPATMGFAQKKAKSSKKVKVEKIAATITEAELKEHLYVIAGAEMEGRETATEGQRKAAAYIEQHFKSIGLLPGNNGSYQQTFPVFRDSLINASLMVNGKAFDLNKDFQPTLQLTRPGSQYFSEVVFAGHGIVDSDAGIDDYGSMDVKGKAVLLLDGAPSSYKTSKRGWRAPNGLYGKYNNAMSKGASAIIIIGNGFPRQALQPNGNMYTNLYADKQPASLFTVSTDLATAIVGEGLKDMITKGKDAAIAPAVFKANTMLELQKKVSQLESTNVLGYIEGSDKKDEWLILTAHYDHLGKRGDVIYYGADDDGSGTVGIMEIAEAFAMARAGGNGPRRNVLVMAVSGEEKGLWGSEYFSENSPVPMDKVTADLNIDMIGRVDTERKSADTLNYVYVVGDDKLSTELKPISEMVNKKYLKLSLDYKYNDPADPNQIYFRSDHFNFARKGVPVIFYYDGMLQADYHKPTDTPDKINYKLLKKRADLVFYTAWEMANRDNMIKRDLELPAMAR